MTCEESYTLAEHFRSLAERLRAKAAEEKTPVRKTEWHRLADCYSSLAAQQSPFDYFQH